MCCKFKFQNQNNWLYVASVFLRFPWKFTALENMYHLSTFSSCHEHESLFTFPLFYENIWYKYDKLLYMYSWLGQFRLFQRKLAFYPTKMATK